jgi:hypothetical protein
VWAVLQIRAGGGGIMATHFFVVIRSCEGSAACKRRAAFSITNSIHTKLVLNDVLK